MPTLHNRDRDLSDYRESRAGREDARDDREISLGTGTILVIFFALALLCAVFFGFGYTMGRKSAQPALLAGASGATSSSANLSAVKPSAGSPAKPGAQAKQDAVPPDSEAESQSSAEPPNDPDATIVTRVRPASEDSASAAGATSSSTRIAVADGTSNGVPVIVKQPVKASPTAAPTPSASAAMPLATSNGTAIVQIAAVSHQEDANVLITELKKRGYAVFIRQEPQDHLLHVQVGPYATKKDAEVMRQRLLADGYNAIIK